MKKKIQNLRDFVTVAAFTLGLLSGLCFFILSWLLELARVLS